MANDDWFDYMHDEIKEGVLPDISEVSEKEDFETRIENELEIIDSEFEQIKGMSIADDREYHIEELESLKHEIEREFDEFKISGGDEIKSNIENDLEHLKSGVENFAQNM